MKRVKEGSKGGSAKKLRSSAVGDGSPGKDISLSNLPREASPVILEAARRRGKAKVDFMLIAPVRFPDGREQDVVLAEFGNADAAKYINRETEQGLPLEYQSMQNAVPHVEERLCRHPDTVAHIQRLLKKKLLDLKNLKAELRIDPESSMLCFPQLYSTLAPCKTCIPLVKRKFTEIFMMHAVLSVLAPKASHNVLRQKDEYWRKWIAYRDTQPWYASTQIFTTELYNEIKRDAKTRKSQELAADSGVSLDLHMSAPWIKWVISVVILDEVAMPQRYGLGLFKPNRCMPCGSGAAKSAAVKTIAVRSIANLGKSDKPWIILHEDVANDPELVTRPAGPAG